MVVGLVEPSDDQLNSPRGNILVVALVFEAGVGAAALGMGWLVDFSPLALLKPSLADFAIGAAAAIPLAVVLLTGWRISWRPIARLRDVVEELIVPLFRGCTAVQLAALSVVAGVGEELLFRGLIQEGLRERIGGDMGLYAGLGVSAVIFGLAHYVTRTYAILAALVGVYLSLLMLTRDNLLVPIATHAVYDFVALLYLMRAACGANAPQ